MAQVKLLLFGPLAEAYGSSESFHNITNNFTINQLIEKLNLTKWKENGLKCAVNKEFTTYEKILSDGDEVVLLTPVSGG